MDKLVSEGDTGKLEELVVVPAQDVGAGLRGCDYLPFATLITYWIGPRQSNLLIFWAT
jgi:hypothetical protein